MRQPASSSSDEGLPDGQQGCGLYREAWHRLLKVSSHTLRALDVELDLHHRLSVSEFDVLITLDNAPDGSYRMTDLARAVMLSSGGLTRLVGRLEQQGLVRRDLDPADARSFHASLTEQGCRRLAEARLTHDAVIERILATPLSEQDLAELALVLGRVLQS
jgi:DNA-binding MarR family transcriptional regulator